MQPVIDHGPKNIHCTCIRKKWYLLSSKELGIRNKTMSKHIAGRLWTTQLIQLTFHIIMITDDNSKQLTLMLHVQ